MRSDLIRSTFFDFFSHRGHQMMPGGPLIPSDDSLLFTNAGMVQFKPYFVGESQPPHPRMMSSQPCIRTVDIENIGHTNRHATSFEMLGSFAFNDYSRLQIMTWALELLVDGYGLDFNRLGVTVFETDDETHGLWQSLGFPIERIQRLGIKDNFWSMGVPGPAGPNTEIFYDGLEIWNLVFMQLLRGDSDEHILGELPGRHIDTGLGLDRLAMILQGAEHIHEIDLWKPLLDKAGNRLVADHLRTSLLMIGEGVTPGTTGRGYVLRRLLRRAIYHYGRSLGELTDNEIVLSEEQLFQRTLRKGTKLLGKALARGEVDGEMAFKLHDTHGFPIDLTEEIAQNEGVGVDRHGYDRLMAEHRMRSKG